MAKRPRAAKPDPAEVEGKPESQSIRLLTEDVHRLNELCALRRDKSVGVTFRTLFGDLLDASLIEAAERRAELVRKRPT